MSKVLSAGRPSARKAAIAKLTDVSVMKVCKRVNFDLGVDEHAKLKVYAASRGLTIRQILTDFVGSLPE